MSATLHLAFEGYFQMRMATDPDPTDDPRGVSGYTFALAGEPDLDGIVHLQPDEDGVWERRFGLPGTPGPRVGVTVRSARRFDGDALTLTDVPELVGTRVAFPGARLEERNGVVVRNDFWPIHPMRLQLLPAGSGDPLLDRLDLLDPADPSFDDIDSATAAMLERRQPRGFVSDSIEVAKATGLPDASPQACIDNRRMRQRNLEELLEVTTDPVERAALGTRITQLNILRRWWDLSVDHGQSIDRRAHQLTLQCYGWDVDVNGPVFANALGGDEAQPWPVSFWMGGWDGDALTAYMSGYVTVPLAG